MDIEEERKAFEENTKAKYPGASLARVKSGAYHNWHVDSAFNGWLDAKRYAAEMAKLTVKIKPKGLNTEFSQYQWVVSLFDGEAFNGVLEDFTTKEDAEAWARNCGYRVIE